MKKLSTLLLALLAATALWAADFIVDGIYYNKLGGDSVEVTSTSPKYSGSVTIPASVTYKTTTYRVTRIGNSAFYQCASLSSVTIPNSVTSIGGYAFWSCKKLISVTIPNSVTSIERAAFYICSSLASITVDAANTHYASIDGVLFNYAKDTLIQYPIGNSRKKYTIPNSVTCIEDVVFTCCDSLTSVTIPNSVTSIGVWAFWSCKKLISVTIGNSVTSIGEEAFEHCSSLSLITCYATTPPTCGLNCFVYVEKSIPVLVPAGSVDAYKAADGWKKFTNIQAISTPTDLRNIFPSGEDRGEACKVIKNGQMVILHNNHTYTLSGTLIE